jgi:hypothetical protein
MNPALIALIIQLVETAVADAPQLYDDLQNIFDNPNPTPADWEALRAKVLAEGYFDYVPDSALAPDKAAQASPAVTPAAKETPLTAPPDANGGNSGSGNATKPVVMVQLDATHQQCPVCGFTTADPGAAAAHKCAS